MNYVPFNRFHFHPKMLEYVEEALKKHTSGDGPFTKRCQSFLEKKIGTKKVLLTPSGTHALELSALLLDLKPGDEFLVPSYTFSSTVNAFILYGLRPIFVDIRPDTLNMDERLLEEKRTPKTRAIVVMHYAGVGCEMDTITKFANKHSLPIIEDNAHGLFGKYQGKFLGGFGCLAAQSFHETKNFSCGEGGALLINDPKYIERAEIIREKGTDRSQFFRGVVDKYSWMDLGSSYVLSDVLAAILYFQLEQAEEIQNQRAKIWMRYYESLQGWAHQQGCLLPTVPKYCEQSYHLFYLIFPTGEARDAALGHFKKENINALFHYQPLHSSKMGKKLGGAQHSCPITESMSARIIRLPFFVELQELEQERVIHAVKKLDFLSKEERRRESIINA